MANRAISQLPEAGTSLDDDIYILVRGGVNYRISRSNMPPEWLSAQTVIPAANVLTLNATPVVVVTAAPAGSVIIPQAGLVEFANGTVNYATNTTLMLISTTATGTPIRIANISNRTLPNAFITPATGGSSPAKDGDSLSVQVLTGNPTAGDSDLTVTIWYTIKTPS